MDGGRSLDAPEMRPIAGAIEHIRKGDTTLSLYSVVATVGTPLDVSLQNLRLELFFPADAATKEWLRRV